MAARQTANSLTEAESLYQGASTADPAIQLTELEVAQQENTELKSKNQKLHLDLLAVNISLREKEGHIANLESQLLRNEYNKIRANTSHREV